MRLGGGVMHLREAAPRPRVGRQVARRQRANDRLEQPHLCTEISFHDLRETHMKASGGIRRTACR